MMTMVILHVIKKVILRFRTDKFFFAFASAFETQMIRKVDFLTASVIHLNDSVQLLLNRQTNTQNTSSTRTRQFNLPITNIEDWKALEEKLKLGDKTLPPENNDDKHVRINDVRAK